MRLRAAVQCVLTRAVQGPGPVLLLAGLLAGCDHAAPFAAPRPGDAGPRTAGNPVRVTYNQGTDLRPTWLPDGSGFFYTQERTDRGGRDRCFARMAAGGGTILEQVCDHGPRSDDSITTFEWAAIAPDGRLAYLRAGTPLVPATLSPRTLELRLGTRAEPEGAILRPFPYLSPSGRIHHSFSFLGWAGNSRLVYLGENVRYASACGGCPPDTVRTGLEVVTIEPGVGVAIVVPGTDRATSVAVSGTDSLFVTTDSSNQIALHRLGAGTVTVAHALGGFVRDVTAAGSDLAAVTEPGLLWFLPAGSTPVALTAPTLVLFRRPALAPAGDRLVVEGYPFRVDTTRFEGMIVAIDTIVSRSADLWLFANLP